MTDRQDDICDALVAAKITRLWERGPLHTAARVIDPSFTLPEDSARRPRSLAHALGWPTLFCSAVFGANSALPDEGDRRSFAITLFASVDLPRTGRFSRIAAGVGLACATWAALRVHPIACSPDCPMLIAVQNHVNGIGPPLPRSFPVYNQKDCLSRSWADSPRGSDEACGSLIALRQLLTYPEYNQGSKVYILKYAARAETALRGVAGAVEFCLTLAQRLGLKPASSQPEGDA